MFTDWLKKKKETFNNLFSQTIFNQPFKYLCRSLCGVVSFRIWDGHKQQEEGKKKEKMHHQEKKKINKQAKRRDTEQFEDERC